MLDGLSITTEQLVYNTPCTFVAADGFALHGQLWQMHQPPHTSLLINTATGVLARYYNRYATYLAQHGFLVLTYDYRGIGASSPSRLRGFRATKHDWGALDCEAAIQTLRRHAPADLPMMAVCHSIGGFALGLAPSATNIQRALFVGCQFAYWQDYRLLVRLPMWLNWHLIMPLLTKIFGYFPGKRLGWLEDLPEGVAMEWATRFHPAFHKRYAELPHAQPPAHEAVLEARMGAIQADILAIADVRDPFATTSATRRLLSHFRNSTREFASINPRNNQLPKLGHFGFFHNRFRNTLWPQSLVWLQSGQHHWPSSFRWPPKKPS